MKQFLTIALLFCSIMVAQAVEFQCNSYLVPEEEPCGNQTCIRWYIQTDCEEYFIDFSTIPPQKVVTMSWTSRKPAIGLE